MKKIKHIICITLAFIMVASCPMQVFEENREEYIKKLAETLKIGKRRAQKICVETYNLVDSQ